MNNEIKIDGIEYIKKSKYNELEKRKVKIKEVTKEIEKVIYKEKSDLDFLKDYAILDPANVCGIFPLIKRDCDGELEEIDTAMGIFKKVGSPKITSEYDENWNVEVLIINGSRYSKEFIDGMRKMAQVWFSDKPEVYMRYNKEEKEFLKHEPLMMVFGNKMCFILAPRIESGDEE